MAESNGSEYIPQRRQGAKGNRFSFWRDVNLSVVATIIGFLRSRWWLSRGCGSRAP